MNVGFRGIWQDSDLDLTCVIPNVAVAAALEIFAEKRQVVLSTLEAAGIEVFQEIWTARVPVVKMKFAGFLEAGLLLFPLPSNLDIASVSFESCFLCPCQTFVVCNPFHCQLQVLLRTREGDVSETHSQIHLDVRHVDRGNSTS